MDILGAYRIAAYLTAQTLGTSPAVESVLVHRSVSTGEVVFGRSDIDLMLVIRRAAVFDGQQMASLWRLVRRARRFNPALSHIDVLEPDGIERLARADTCLASTERHSLRRLCGKPATFPELPVEPSHALARFVLWAEWYFAIALQTKNRRNIRKIALEMWNTYAVAEGLLAEPLLRRDEMESHLCATEGAAAARYLDDPARGAAFTFDLARRLHRSRLPELGQLPAPLVFETTTAPLGLRRVFAVVPRADSRLPPEVFARPGVFPCIPEVLHLHLHYRNAYLAWAMPAQLLDLGMKLPGPSRYLATSRNFNDDRFLRVPGFASAHSPGPAAMLSCLRYALPFLQRGEVPPPFTAQEMQSLASGVPSIDDYYRLQYPALRREIDSLREGLDAAVC